MTWRSLAGTLTALILLSLLLVACRSSPREDDTSPTVTEAISAAEQPQPAPPTIDSMGTSTDSEGDPAASGTSPAGNVGVEPGAALPDDFTAMLARLGDYRMEVNLSFEGQDGGGTPVAFEMVSSETVAFDPPRRRLDLSAAEIGESSQVESMTLLRIDDTGYLVVPEIGCISGDSEDFVDAMRLPVDPRVILAGWTDSGRVDSNVVVNGLETDQFHFDEASLPWTFGGPWSISGSAFVEEGSDFVTRIAMTLDGRGDLLADGRTLDGEYDIVINITRLGDDDDVFLPDACRQSALYPLPPDAFEVTTIENLVTFKSHLPIGDVVDFYLSQMTSAGWQPLSEPDVFEDLAILNFARDGSPLMITIEYDAASEMISVLISP